MSDKKITPEDIASGVYGDFLVFGGEFDPIAWARQLKLSDVGASLKNINEALEFNNYLLNVLLIGRIPDQTQRDIVIRAAREVMALLVMRVTCEYEGASRSVRINALHEGVARKGLNSEAVTWIIIEEYIEKNNGALPLAKQIDRDLVKARRKELGLKPERLSQHQIERHLTSWRKSHRK